MNCAVEDPFGLAADPALPGVAVALDPRYMARRLAELGGALAGSTLESIRVTRHKPGKRCIIEYALRDAAGEGFALLAKLRSNGDAVKGVRVIEAFRRAGFDESAADGIGVAEPVACFADIGMWLQRKIDGQMASDLMATAGVPTARRIAARIAEAACKIHWAGVETRRAHGIDDELRILDVRLGRLAVERRALARRLVRLLAACARRSATVPVRRACGIHRDYYADQIIVAGERLYVIDFDLYCLGDPALDIGNFIAHVIEQALRQHGRAEALDYVGEAARERFLQLAGIHLAPAVDLYVDLTLVRHIHLSTLLPARQGTTDALLALCEERFSPWLV